MPKALNINNVYYARSIKDASTRKSYLYEYNKETKNSEYYHLSGGGGGSVFFSACVQGLHF